MDQDGDGVIGLHEFMVYVSQKQLFDTNEGWKSLMEEELFTDKDMEDFEENYEDSYYNYEYDENGNIIGIKTKTRKSQTKTKEPQTKTKEG